MLFNTAKEIPIIRNKTKRKEVSGNVATNIEVDQENVTLADTLLSEEVVPLSAPIDNTEDAMIAPKTVFIEKREEVLFHPTDDDVKGNTQETISARSIDNLSDIAKRLYVRDVGPMSIDLSKRLK